MFNDPQTITVSGTARDYVSAWDAEFSKELATGAASIRKKDLPDGNSVLRIAQSEQKGQERHLIALREKHISDDGTSIVRAYIVIENPADNPSLATEAIALGVGLCSYVTASSAAVLTAVVAGQI